MESIKINQVALTDITQLQKIGRETFFESFSAVNTEEDMRQYLEESFSADKLTAELSNKSSQFCSVEWQDYRLYKTKRR